MGSAQSRDPGLVRQVSSEHHKKVGPLLRANHKHQLLLTTLPRQVTRISQSLAAACLLDIQPVSALFDLWDKVALDTLDVTDSEEEIVQVDYLSPDHLGHEDQTTRYVDYFDDEVVRLLYSYTACMKQYLQVDEVIAGLMARDGWGIRQLAYAVEMGSKDMCTEALGGALSFYEPLTDVTGRVSVPETEQEVIAARNTLIEETLREKGSEVGAVSALVVLNSICAVWSFTPRQQFSKMWQQQVDKIAALPKSASRINESDVSEAAWPAIIRDVCETKPFLLPELRLLKDHPRYGLSVAKSIFATS